MYAAWYEIRRISKFDGQKIKADETPYTFLKRLGDEYGEEVLSLSADSFNKLLYSKKALITREDRAYAEAAYKALDKHISTRHKIEEKWRNLHWVYPHQRDRTGNVPLEERIAFWKEELKKDNLESYFITMYKNYVENAHKDDEYFKEYLALTDALYTK